MSCFDKMLRLTDPYSLLYRDLLLFILSFLIFHSFPDTFLYYLVSGGCIFFICTCFFWLSSLYRTKKQKTRNLFKKWPLDLWWISNKTILEVKNITKAATVKSVLHLSYKNTQSLFLWQCFLIFSWVKH